MKRKLWNEIFGILKNSKLDAQKIKDDLRKESAKRDKKLSRLFKKLKKF